MCVAVAACRETRTCIHLAHTLKHIYAPPKAAAAKAYQIIFKALFYSAGNAGFIPVFQ
jgi:hypothetical protein